MCQEKIIKNLSPDPISSSPTCLYPTHIFPFPVFPYLGLAASHLFLVSKKLKPFTITLSDVIGLR